MMPKEIDLPLFHHLHIIVFISLCCLLFISGTFLTKCSPETNALSYSAFFNAILYLYHVVIMCIYFELLEQSIFQSMRYNLLNCSIVRHLFFPAFDIIHDEVKAYFCSKFSYSFLKLFFLE